jgi:2-methylcitrate dehydratase PrpD
LLEKEGLLMVENNQLAVIDSLSGNIVNTRFEDLDKNMVEEAKKRVIDVLGCLIGGANAPGNRALLNLVKDWGGKEESTILVHGGKVPAQNAAMMNTIMDRSFDFEVMSYAYEGNYLASHHAATLIPTAIAMAESRGASGKEMITALLVGEDLAARVQAASAGHPIRLGWDGCGTLSHLGATATACRLMGLDRKQTRHALGIVLNLIASAIQSLWDGATTFKLGQGTAARNGIFAAELSRAGWTGAEDALLSSYGYFFLYAGGCKDPQILTRDLGKKFYAESYFKPYPCGMPNHQAIDAALAIANKYEIDMDKIEEIIIHVPYKSIGSSYYAKPFIVREFPHGDAIFSYPYTVATSLLYGSCNLNNFTENAITDPRVNALTAKTRLVERPEGIMGVQVQVMMQGGQVFSESKTANREWVTKPWPKDQILAKFWHQVDFSKTIRRDNAEKLLGQIENLDRVEKLDPLIKLMVQ